MEYDAAFINDGRIFRTTENFMGSGREVFPLTATGKGVYCGSSLKSHNEAAGMAQPGSGQLTAIPGSPYAPQLLEMAGSHFPPVGTAGPAATAVPVLILHSVSKAFARSHQDQRETRSGS